MTRYSCQCDCGKVVLVRKMCLVTGGTKSCGCLLREKCVENGRKVGKLNKDHLKTHGKSGTKIYSHWVNMKARATRAHHYPGYAEKGITISAEWKDSFAIFYRDMGDPPFKRATIDRIDNTKGYSADNCRWATSRAQAFNQSRNKWIEFNGKRMSITQWSTSLGGAPNLIRTRLTAGWSLKRALETPPQKFNERAYQDSTSQTRHQELLILLA